MEFILERAEQDDGAALNHLFRCTPQDGPVEVVFEREPDFFAASHVMTETPSLWLAREAKNNNEDTNVVGALSMGGRFVYVNGKAEFVRYYSDLRIHPDYQKGTLLSRLFRQGKKDVPDSDDWGQTVILDDNSASKGNVAAGRAGLPGYYLQGSLNSYYINNGRTKAPSTLYSVRRADKKDVGMMQAFFDREAKKFQGFPLYYFDKVGGPDQYYLDQNISDYYLVFDHERLVGMTSVWNQKEIKQVRFSKYKGINKYLRYLSNVSGFFRQASLLPKEGGLLEYRYLHCVLVENNSPDYFDALLQYIVFDYGNKGEALMLGLLEDSPLNVCISSYRHRKTQSLHYLVSHGKDPRIELRRNTEWYLEASRL